MPKPRRSEFEKDGVFPFGFFGLGQAKEKLRYAMRTEQDPEGGDPKAKADKFEHGGIESLNDIKIR